MQIKKIVLGLMQNNCYVISNESECVVIDPAKNAQKILDEIGNLSLKAILLTHNHFDHIGAVATLKEKTGAPIYIGFDDIKDLPKNFVRGVKEFEADFSVKDGDILDFGILVIHTPGHTKGSVCYLLDDMLFSGDTLFYMTCGRWDFPTGSETEMRKSLSRLATILPPGTKVFPGHGEETSIDFEIKNNPYMSIDAI